MKKSIKSILTIGFLMLVISFLASDISNAQGRGFGSKGVKAGSPGLNWVDANGDGICDNFVDANGDGINDNPQGFRGGKNAGSTKPYGAGRFGSASGVCDGTAKGKRGFGNQSGK